MSDALLCIVSLCGLAYGFAIFGAAVETSIQALRGKL